MLRQGKWREGFNEFEWRVKAKPPVPVPEACLSDPPGTRVLIWKDQGLGDALQYLRFVVCLNERGFRIFLHLPKALVRLGQSMLGVEGATSTEETPPAVDRQLGLGRLPWLIGVDTPAGTWHGPYLFSPRNGPRLTPRSSEGEHRVGIVWAGSPIHPNDQFRSATVPSLAPLFDVPGVTWYSLQIGRWDEPRPSRAIDLAPRIKDCADTAALLAQMDLLITVDTSISHLAGALGIPTWVLLPHRIDWRWSPGEGISDWYPSIRIFRQPSPGDWLGLASIVRDRLRTFAAGDGV